MKEFIEKLIGRLEEEKNTAYNTYNFFGIKVDLGRGFGLEKSIEIVNQLAEEYKTIDVAELVEKFGQEKAQSNDGWIPCSERLPEEGVKVLCFGKNSFGRMKYEVATYSHELGWWMCSIIADVIAWQPLPEPYKGEFD